MRSDTLKVAGAIIYYETRGSGPVLLLLPGSGGDAAVFDSIADTLAEHFTVVAVDPRGYSRSTLDSEDRSGNLIEAMALDAHQILEHLTPPGEDAYVFSGSGGAVVALELLARHPERLRLVVAHEPPMFGVLPDAAEHRAFVAEVRELFHTQGYAAAGARFVAGIGGTIKDLPDPDSLPPRTAAMLERLMANGPLMFEHELEIVTAYLPDRAALAKVRDRLVLGAGELTRGQLPHRPAAKLAEELEVPLTVFPGGHSGFTDEPTAFTRLLLEKLGVSSASPEPGTVSSGT
ncbi:alpha/beta hydrolase [Nocardia australiensis]|uniref:alpha/beta hydrolase n=1 Tax=Nocardia australiensis TaxID=2887191 RepID=UPI001D1443A5|nr:alpha/beta hydrolase [Nocardia australiensis]